MYNEDMQADKVIIFKALADEVRLGLVRKLANDSSPKPTCDIVESCASFLELSQPTMSHHVNKLVNAGILIEFKKSKQKSYVLNKELLVAAGIDVTKI